MFMEGKKLAVGVEVRDSVSLGLLFICSHGPVLNVWVMKAYGKVDEVWLLGHSLVKWSFLDIWSVGVKFFWIFEFPNFKRCYNYNVIMRFHCVYICYIYHHLSL